MDDALARGLVERAARGDELLGRGGLVAGGDGLVDLLDGRLDRGAHGLVALLGLAVRQNALLLALDVRQLDRSFP